jgi:HD-like signal output (HDOD) protein
MKVEATIHFGKKGQKKQAQKAKPPVVYQSQLRISHFHRVAGRMLRIQWLVGSASVVACF